MSGRVCCSLALLSVLLTPSQTCDNSTHYSWNIDMKRECCTKCPPGTKLVSRCTRSNLKSKCESCISGTFSASWNIYGYCPLCKTCSEANGLQIEMECTKKSQVKCTCRPGYALNAAPPTDTEKCFKICNEGEQVKRGDSNACEPCLPGFYSNKKGTKSCKAWTRCTDDQRYLIKNGSQTEDAVCSSSEPRQTTTSKRRPPSTETTPSTTLLRITTHPTSATTTGRPSLLKDNAFFICVIVVTALLLFIVIFRRMMSCKDGHRGFRCCFGDRNFPKAPIPVQEEFNDITSVQVKN
ncbi:tumor necrosis factor receptor superfamily member 5-like isoform X2 [Leucoraja erinacea]|uniref:tumor necrosis factor receptor superfamily member 5-like isoform X2 n=1 Tax=Leucoraja erinaceus TaxID=7782 RepID=UPI0024563F03|nr:tumor necrosis factor receptor superfamily member 5-like isoform X2 [Leucoraja erinacea]